MRDSDFSKELFYTASKSSGPGGQNVNKVNSQVTLRFDVANSSVLSEEEKEIILKRLSSKLTKEGVLILSAQGSRSQHQNKEAVLLKFHRLMEKAMAKKSERKPTKPSNAAIKKRIEEKKKQSEKKRWRKIY